MRSHWLVAVLAGVAVAGCQARSEDSTGGGKARGKPKAGGGVIASVVKPKPVVIPEGTLLSLVLETSLSSKSSREGDLVVARLASDVKVGERVVLSAGAEVRGRVTAAVPSGKVKTRARLAWDFDRVLFKGQEHPIEARAVDITAPDTHRRDAGTIAGGAGAGALIGALVDGKKGAAIGAAVGGAAGTGVVLTTTGKEVVVPAGSRVSVKLAREARLS